jgi:hypothetical protein
MSRKFLKINKMAKGKIEKAEVAVVEQIPAELTEVVVKSGLAMQKAMDIFSNYVPLMEEVKEKSELLAGLDPKNPKDVVIARRVRADLGKVNGKAEALKKADKAVALAVGRCVDGAYNSVVGPSKLIQAEASEIINYAEEQEKLRIEALQLEREKLLEGIHENPSILNLGVMEDSLWEATLNGFQLAHEKKIQEEKDRIAAEERLQKRNELLRPYSNELFELYPQINLVELSEEELVSVVGSCKASFEEKEKLRIEKELEAERLRKELEEEKARKIESDKLFNSRLARLTNVAFDGRNYRANLAHILQLPTLVTIDAMRTLTNEEFDAVVKQNMYLQEKYKLTLEKQAELRLVDHQLGLNDLWVMSDTDYKALLEQMKTVHEETVAKALEEKAKKDAEDKRIAEENAAKLKAIEEQRLEEEKLKAEKDAADKKLTLVARMDKWVKESQLRILDTSTIKKPLVKEVTENIQTKYAEFLAYAENELKRLV